MFRVELGKRLAAGDVGARSREPRKDFAARQQQEARPLANSEGLLEGGGRGVLGSGQQVPSFGFRVSSFRRLVSDFGFRISDFQVRDDDLHVVFLVAVEFHERLNGEEAAVGAHERVALRGDPRGDGLVVSLASTHERGAQVEMLRLSRLGRGQHAGEQPLELADR
jgi:hypothetical protein